MSQLVTIVGPNLPQQASAEFHVHAAGCSDLKRGWIKRYAAEGWTIEVDCLLDVEADVYDFAPAESPGYKLGDYIDQFHFAPCVTLPERVELACCCSTNPGECPEHPDWANALCGICGESFDGVEWENRHSAEDGDDVHDRCCEARGPCAGPQVEQPALVEDRATKAWVAALTVLNDLPDKVHAQAALGQLIERLQQLQRIGIAQTDAELERQHEQEQDLKQIAHDRWADETFG